jgi:ABC-type dipeptide/oligopeptide/nickel transport system permease subunit
VSQLPAEIDLEPAEPAPAALGIVAKSPGRLAWARLRRDRVAIVSALVIAGIVVVALCAPLIADAVGHHPDQTDQVHGLSPEGLPRGPSWSHPFGTDSLGRDVFIRVIYAARISLLAGVVASSTAVVVGVVVGLLAGYTGGVVDNFLSRTMDVILSFPFLLFGIALVSIVGPSLGVVIGVIAFFSWASVGRIVRGQTISLKEREYVEAARSLGASGVRIMFSEIFPNLVAPVLVYLTLLIPSSIVFEATLSFLGLGVVPPTPTWGNMLSESLGFYQVAWWYVLFPAAALLMTTLAFNLLGDSVRDAFDPRGERLFRR